MRGFSQGAQAVLFVTLPSSAICGYSLEGLGKDRGMRKLVFTQAFETPKICAKCIYWGMPVLK